MARPKGQPKLGGRKKGTPNKLTREAKDALASVFERMGGEDALLAWAVEKQDVFYSALWPKLLPLQVNGTHDVNHHDDEGRRAAEEQADRLMRELAILSGAAAVQDEPGIPAGVRPSSTRLQ
jgi:hypothetical protein